MNLSTIRWISLSVVVFGIGCHDIKSKDEDSDTARRRDVAPETDTEPRETAGDTGTASGAEDHTDEDRETAEDHTDEDRETASLSEKDSETETLAGTDTTVEGDTIADTDTDSGTTLDTETALDTDTETGAPPDSEHDSETALSPPEGCIFFDALRRENECTAEVRCDLEKVRVICQQSEDALHCLCENHLGSFPFEADPPGVTDTCMYFTDLCNRLAKAPAREHSCEQSELFFHDEPSCMATAPCTLEVTLPEGVFTSLPVNHSAYCDEDIYKLICGCAAFDNSDVDFTVKETPISAQTCAAAWEYCNSNSPLIAETPPTCAPEIRNSEPAYCQIVARCNQWGWVDDVEVAITEQLWFDCMPGVGDAWLCDCDGTYIETTADDDACGAAAEACYALTDLEALLGLDDIGRPVIYDYIDAGIVDADGGV